MGRRTDRERERERESVRADGRERERELQDVGAWKTKFGIRYT